MHLSRTWLGDHHKYHTDYSVAGIPLIRPFMGCESQGTLGNFAYSTFELPHGDTKSYGFYIRHPELGKLLFLTDFEFCPFDMSKLKVNHILIEANYQLDMVDTDAANFEHKVRGHCSLDTATEFVRHNNSTELRNVVLIHGSDATLDGKHAVDEIKSVVDADVNVVQAHRGLEIELSKEVF